MIRFLAALSLALLPMAAMAQTAAPFVATGCTAGTSSAQCLAAGWLHSITVQNVSAGANVACAFGATAGLNTVGSIMLAPGQAFTFGPNTSGMPQVALNCIASAAGTPITVVGY